MQNKPNFRKTEMNVNKVLAKDYENKRLCGRRQNKPNLLNAKMNVSSVLTKDYENIANCKLCENKANSKPIQSQTNPISEKPKWT